MTSAAYAAGLALVIIQVGSGLVYKAAQRGDKYTFSQSGAVCVSEFLKLLIATSLYYREWWRRGSDYRAIKEEVDDALEMEVEPSKSWGAFRRACLTEVSPDSKYGFIQLSLFYVVINNTVFVLFKLADPGTIQLLKSGITIVTALVMVAAFGTKIAKLQWVAIVFQVCGLIVSQYNPETGTAYPFTTYMLLIFQTIVSAVAGVYNQGLNKSSGASLHADNMVLYTAGTCINLVIHLVLRLQNPDEPGFFTGYGNLGAIALVLSNVFVGLAVTAVYKYADAVIKCFATSLSTGILLYLSPLLFHIEFSFLTVPGTLVVFLATWLYLEAAPPKQEASTPKNTSWWGKVRHSLGKGADGTGFRVFSLTIKAIVTITIVVICSAFSSTGRTSLQAQAPDMVESPFKDTMAWLRINSHIPERIQDMENYRPFFYDLHFSMPGTMDHTNLTGDSEESGDIIYKSVADTMRIILDEHPTVRGLLFFHFDAWIHPLRFSRMDFNNIWFPDSINPRYLCTKDVAEYPWVWWEPNEGRIRDAYRTLKNLSSAYDFDADLICSGWSDIFYIPRRFFKDFIFLSDVFSSFEVFLEVAIPTMVNTIETTYHLNHTGTALTPIQDCWGHCCTGIDPSPDELKFKRCGHPMRLDHEGTKVFWESLEESRGLLGMPKEAKWWPPR